MPRLDGTGPMGMGPMTGRGLGPCGYGIRGRGRGMGYGMMMGGCPWYGQIAKPTPAEEKQILADQIAMLKDNLEVAQKRLSELDNQK